MKARSAYLLLLPLLPLAVILAISDASASHGADEAMRLASDSFSPGGKMGRAQILGDGMCPGDNLSPELHWSGVPSGTRSLALTMWDPDAPRPGGFWHWLVLDLPPGTTRLDAGAGTSIGRLPTDSLMVLNDFGVAAYGGPCPPSGTTHHYVFTLWALDISTVAGADAFKGGALAADLARHALATATLTGLYGD